MFTNNNNICGYSYGFFLFSHNIYWVMIFGNHLSASVCPPHPSQFKIPPAVFNNCMQHMCSTIRGRYAHRSVWQYLELAVPACLTAPLCGVNHVRSARCRIICDNELTTAWIFALGKGCRTSYTHFHLDMYIPSSLYAH